MNKRCFKTVFSARLGTLVAVGEHANSQGKANGAHGAGTLGAQSFRLAQLIHHFVGALTASFALVTLAWAQLAVNALPTGGQVAQGAVQFSQSAQQLNINQASDRAAVNWQSFDIGAAAKVNVVQPSAQSVLLNRVGGTAPSQIFGQLSANGRVILVNPNGMVFGKDGSVSASAFTGSTLNISDADFMAGKERYTRDGAAGAIVNRGLIQAAPGGYVALLGASVSNEGHIVAPQGNVFMAAADAVTLPSPTVGLPIGQSGRIKLELTPASINAAVANQKGGTIVTEGGQVYLQAAAVNAALATIIQSGSIDTTGEQGGAVHVLADGGHIRVDGSIKANSTNGTAGGDIYIGRDKDTNVLGAVGDASGAYLESRGGFVETSGSFLKTTGTRVLAKDWLLDPTNITIAASGPTGDAYSDNFTASADSVILASDIVASLNAGTSVSIQTGAGGAGAGDINVDADIVKASGASASLTLTAHRDVLLNNSIKTTSGDLNISLNASTGKVTGVGGLAAGSGGLITINTATNGELSGIIESGALLKTGAGQTKLSAMSGGTNTFAGGTTISRGTLLLGNGDGRYNRTAGVGAITLGDANTGSSNVSLLLEKGKDVSQDPGKLTRTVTVTNQGTGTVTLGGVVGSAGGTGWTAFGGPLVLHKNINFSDGTGDRTSIDGLVSGTGSITLTGGRCIMSSSALNTFTGDYIVNSGTTLQLNSGLALSANNNLVNNGTTRLNGGTSLAINSLTGAGIFTSWNLGSSSATTLSLGNNNGSGTYAGVISENGPALSVVKNGSGTQVLTGANSYTGITTINTGTLQIGNATTTGTLGTGAVTNNGHLTFNRSNAMTVSNVIGGSGTVNQAGTGTTTLAADNSYSGATTVSAGTLQVGSGGASGTLGNSTGVTLSNNANLTFSKNVNTVIDKAIGGNGNVTANISADLALNSDISLTGTNTINLTASGSIVQTAGGLAATNLYLTATSGSIGTTSQRINTNVNNLSLNAAGDAFVTEANALNFAASVDNLDVTTTNGSLAVGAVNSITGITATGDVTLTGSTNAGNGIYIGQNITATTGNVSLTGTTSSASYVDAGIKSAMTVEAENITLQAVASSPSGLTLGYYGAGGLFTASEQLNLTGISNNSGNGFYSFTGGFTSGAGMRITGSSAAGQGVGFDNNITLTNGSSGGISITGTATNASQQAIGLRGTAFTNGGGDTSLNAINGVIFTSAGNPAVWGGVARTNTITNSGTGAVRVTAGNNSAGNSGAIVGSVLSITQNSDAGVEVRSSGVGNVTVPAIVNAGTGDIVVAAGSAIAAGTGTGGQVLTLATNTLSHTNAAPGKTYVYSGAPETSGVMGHLSADFSTLFYQGTTNALNAGFGQGFDVDHADDMLVPNGGSASASQVFFRTANKPVFSLTLSNNTKVYGDADPVGWSSTNGAALTNAVAGVGGSNTFEVATSSVLASLTGGRAAGEDVGSYAYSLSAGGFNATLTAQPDLVIGKRDITLDTLEAAHKVYDGSSLATITSGTFGNLHNAETLLISGQGVFDDKNVANGKTVTVADVSALTKTNGTGNWNNYNLTTTSKTTTANITKAMLTVTARDDAKFVTQPDVANFDGVNYSGFKLGDAEADLDTSGLAITRTNAVNDTAADNYSGVLVPAGLSAVNYEFTYVNGNYRIVPANQLLVRTTSQSLVYGEAPTFDTTAAYLDGNANVINTLSRTGSNNNYTFNDAAGTSVTMTLKPYSGDTVATQSTSGNTVVGNYDVKDLAYTQSGTNFTGTPVFVGTLSVTPKAVTPNATGLSKVYDATTSMGNVVVGMTGKITNDLVTISGTGAFSQPTVGINLAYDVTGVALSSVDAGNYYLTNGVNSFSGTDGEITRASLVATANSLSTTFNGTAQSVSGFTVSGLLGNDLVSDLTGVSASGATGTNAGTYANTMTVADQTNYTVTGVDGALVINAAPITITGISGALTGTVSKVYDGTTSAVLSPANYVLTGWLGSDGATVTKSSGTYNNPNVGAGKQVTVSLGRSDFLAKGATDLSNYTLPTSVTGAVGVITPKDVSLSSFTVADKVYDGSSLATMTSGSVLTGVGAETLSVKGTGTFADKNVGDAKVVTAADVSTLTKLDGTGSWLNYKLINSPVTSTASISPKPIEVSGLVADKVYDGSVVAKVTEMAAVGVVTGDTVYVQSAAAEFADKDVSRDGVGGIVSKVVNVSGLSLSGVDAGNYLLARNTGTAQAKITPRPLQLSAQALDKPYDTTTLATIKLGSLQGLVGAEQLLVTAAGAFENAEVGTNKLVNVRLDLGNGANGGLATNYALPPQLLRASILSQRPMPPVQPLALPSSFKPVTSAVTFTGPALAAVGEQAGVQPSVVHCDLPNVEDCTCEPSKLDDVLICYVPRDATATGRLLPSNTGAFAK